MSAFTMHIPERLTGDTKRDMAMLQDWGVALIDNLSYMFGHLNEANVQKAASVDAENINTNTALIQDAQIRKLRADKIAAGTLDLTHGITIAGEGSGGNRYLTITENSLCFVDDGIERLYMGKQTITDEQGQKRELFVFRLAKKGEDGTPVSTIWIDDDGDAHFAGTVEGGYIISDTNIDVTTDLHVGNNIYLKTKEVVGQENKEASIFFHDENDVEYGRINYTMGTGTPAMNLVANSGDLRLSSGTSGAVYINGEKAATQSDIQNLQNQIDALKGGSEGV